jgi:hypothetical protein
MKIGETAHYELLTMEIYTRALRCAVRPGKTAFKVTPKQGCDGGGLAAVRKLHLVLLCTALLATGTIMRALDLAGVGPLPDLPGVAAAIVPLLGLIELRRLLRTLVAVGRRRQRRLIYRFAGDAEARCFSADGAIDARLIDASPAGLGLLAGAPLAVGSSPGVLLSLDDAAGVRHEVAAEVEVKSCREADGRFLIGATIAEIEPEARLRLMEWCYVVCSHEQLRGRRPAAPLPEREAIVVNLGDFRMPAGLPLPAVTEA